MRASPFIFPSHLLDLKMAYWWLIFGKTLAKSATTIPLRIRAKGTGGRASGGNSTPPHQKANKNNHEAVAQATTQLAGHWLLAIFPLEFHSDNSNNGSNSRSATSNSQSLEVFRNSLLLQNPWRSSAIYHLASTRGLRKGLPLQHFSMLVRCCIC